MPTVKGTMIGSKVEIHTEDPNACAMIQKQIHNWFDKEVKEGCPPDCPFVIRKAGDKPPFEFVCDVMNR